MQTCIFESTHVMGETECDYRNFSRDLPKTSQTIHSDYNSMDQSLQYSRNENFTIEVLTKLRNESLSSLHQKLQESIHLLHAVYVLFYNRADDHSRYKMNNEMDVLERDFLLRETKVNEVHAYERVKL